MSIMSVSGALDRIGCADRKSPIAVFTTERQGLVNVVFAGTALSQMAIDRKNKNLIGIYHGGMNRELVREELHQAIKRNGGLKRAG